MIRHVCGCVCRGAVTAGRAGAPALGSWPAVIVAAILVIATIQWFADVLMVLAALAVAAAVAVAVVWLARQRTTVVVAVTPVAAGTGRCVRCGVQAVSLVAVAEREALVCAACLPLAVGAVERRVLAQQPAITRGGSR